MLDIIIRYFYTLNKMTTSTRKRGGLKTAKHVIKSTLQEDINKDLLERIPIDAFIQEHIQLIVKNTVGVICKKCGSDDVYCESRQLRSIDEATTKLYTCLNCGNKWRVD